MKFTSRVLDVHTENARVDPRSISPRAAPQKGEGTNFHRKLLPCPYSPSLMLSFSTFPTRARSSATHRYAGKAPGHFQFNHPIPAEPAGEATGDHPIPAEAGG